MQRIKKSYLRNIKFLLGGLIVFLIASIILSNFGLLNFKQNFKITNALSTITWKEYHGDYFSAKYPPDWELKKRDTFYVFDPNESYLTHSRPPKIDTRMVSISRVEITNKSAEQFVDEKFLDRENEIRKYKEQWERNQKEIKYDYPQTYTNPFPPYRGRISTKKGNIEFEVYNESSKAGMYSNDKSFAISNGKVLLSGIGTFENFNDGSIESQILKSITFKD